MDDFKQTMIKNMFKILSDKEISNASKEHILDMYCWILTERIEGDGNKSKNAKFKGCVYWSQEAYNQFIDTNNISGLRHEHVVPRSLFRAYVREIFGENWCNHSIDENIIKSAIDRIYKCFIGCVVTKKEADAIDSEFKDSFPNVDSFADITEKNLWDRYKAIKILPQLKVSEVKWTFENGRWSEPKKLDEYILNVKEAKK